MLRAIEQTLRDLRDIRTESAFDALLKKAMKRIEELELNYNELPRARRSPARLTGQIVLYAATTISCSLPSVDMVEEFTCPSNRTGRFIRSNNNIMLSAVCRHGRGVQCHKKDSLTLHCAIITRTYLMRLAFGSC